MVELDNFKSQLQSYKAPLQEVRIHFDLAGKEQNIQELEREMEASVSGMILWYPRRK